MIATADVRVHPRRQQFGEHARRRPRTVHPAVETRVTIVDGVGRDQRGELRVDGGRIGRRVGQRVGRERLAHRARHLAPRVGIADVA
jgi:hypothetical protein